MTYYQVFYDLVTKVYHMVESKDDADPEWLYQGQFDEEYLRKIARPNATISIHRRQQ
jgi:hypothetical protein